VFWNSGSQSALVMEINVPNILDRFYDELGAHDGRSIDELIGAASGSGSSPGKL
jgi:hypothetical protein